MRKGFIKVTLLVMAALLLTAAVMAVNIAPARASDLVRGERTIDGENIMPVSGYWRYRKDTITISGRLFDGYGHIAFFDKHVSFDVRGWDFFSAWIGFTDGDQTGDYELTAELDGVQVFKRKFKLGEPPLLLRLPLNGVRALKLIEVTTNNRVVFAEPRLIKGPLPPVPGAPAPVVLPQTDMGTVTPGAAAPAASFAVDPSDLQKLAAALRKRVDANGEVKQRVDNGMMAVMTFNLLDIASPTVAANVAEDLSTDLINSGFNLVERGQLDKALKELKIQDSGLVDPATAKKLGQITGCDIILIGSISDRGQFVVINARLLETATGRAVAAERVEMRKISIAR